MNHYDGKGSWLKNVALDKYTSWRVGGVGSEVLKPIGIDDLKLMLALIPSDKPISWLGLGSNTLIRDGGNPGVTILTQGALAQLDYDGDLTIKAQAGVACAKIARFCARNNLGDAEFWAGIPGTMGGALRMNAGCFNGETWDHLESVETINRQGELRVRSKEDFSVGYRSVSGLNEDEWFVSGTFKLPFGEKQYSLATIKSLLSRRAASQPTGEFNCGSVFRNPDGDFAARLIESSNLKGMHVGGAFVSTKHANFITNDGTATANDIEKLINLVVTTVFDKTGISLKQEVHVMGVEEESNNES